MTSYFVTGASRGIGLELARRLASLSTTAHVFAGARNLVSLEKSLTANSKVTPIKLDVLSIADTTAAVETISKITGGSLDVLVVNAGISITDYVAHSSVEELRTTLETNTIAVHRIVQACLPLLRTASAKKIVVLGAASGTFPIASQMASLGMPAAGVYAVSKAATHMLNMLYGVELAQDGVLSVSIHPGLVMTDMSAQVMRNHPEMEEMISQGGLEVITPAESAEGIVKVIEGLSAERSGKLISWQGEILPF